MVVSRIPRLSILPLAVLLCTVLVVAPSTVHAQSVGKITGMVEDEQGVPLAGVNVYVAGKTFLGATSDADGRYTILSVPPGTYTVVFSFVGFTTLKKADVEVFSGRTTMVDGVLQEEVLEGGEIVVRAERPVVVRDRTSTVSFVQQEAIERLPAQEIGDLVAFQPGVVQGAGGAFHFRGGRSRETAYLIDGVPVQDVFNQGGGNTVDVEVQSVQELQVFTGTFDAEFGGAQSGVVSITTRDPSETLTGQVRLLSGGFFAASEEPFMGGDVFRPFDTRDVALTLQGPLAGPRIGFFLSGRYEDRAGPFKGIRRFTPEDGARIAAYRRWYKGRFDPADTRRIALDTARTPAGRLLTDADGDPMTFASGDGATVDMDWRESLTVNPKLVLRPTPRTRLDASVLLNRTEQQGYSDAFRYAPDFRDVVTEQSVLAILGWKQTLGQDMVAEARGSYRRASVEAEAFDGIDDGGHRYLGAFDEVTGFSLGGTDNTSSRREERQLYLRTDLTWQVNPSNEFKTGVQLRRTRYIVEDRDRNWILPDDSTLVGGGLENFPWPDPGAYAQFDGYYAAVQERLPRLVPELPRYAVDDRFDQAPLELSAYVQDKLEFDRRIVVKAGVRADYFAVGEDRLVSPRAKTDVLGAPDNFETTPPKLYVSPRLGLSFPISSRGAFRVAYGHFVQMPAYREMLKNPIFGGINVGQLEGRPVGNPDLEPERTVKYELGLQQQLTGFLGLDVNLYYKNIRNLLGTEILTTLDNIQYTRTINRDYGLVRGASLAFSTRPVGPLLSAALDVTYSDARGSASSPGTVATLVTAGRSGEAGDFIVQRQVIPLSWDQTWTANLSATVGEADTWSVGVIGQLASGQPYTPTFLDPDKQFPDDVFDNSEQKPTQFRLDLSATKHLRLAGLRYDVRLQVNNVFNVLNEQVVNSISGRADQIVRLPVVVEDRAQVMDVVGLFSPAQADVNPHWYSAPREILLSITARF